MITESMPVTVVVSRRAAPRNERALVVWADRMCATAAAFPGYLGGKVQTVPGDDHSDPEVVLGLSFATGQDLLVWEQSDERAACLLAGEALTKGPARGVSIDSLDGRLWVVQDPGRPMKVSRSISTLIVWLALFPPAVLLNVLMESFADSWPIGLRTLVMTAILVPVVMLGTAPIVHRLYRRLFPNER